MNYIFCAKYTKEDHMIKDKPHGNLDFSRLWLLLEKKKLNKQWLLNNGVNKATIYKMVRNENVNSTVLCELCCLLNCKIQDICEYRPEEKH